MKKLLSILMLLVAIVTGAWADPITEKTWDFTALTAADLTALKGNTDAFTDDTGNKQIKNKGEWAKGDITHALEGSDGTDISVADGLLFGRVDGGKINAGGFIYYYGDDKKIYYNNSKCAVKLPSIKGGQIVRVTTTNYDGTVTLTNGSGATVSAGVITFSVTENGVVQIQFDSKVENLKSIVVSTPVIPGAVTFSPASGSSVNAGSSITLSAENATSYKYKWTNSTDTPTDGWSTGNKATVPAFGSENVYLHACGVSAAGDGAASYAQYTITQPVVATPTFSPSSSYFTAASINVTISCATADADIQYSYDNSTWTNYTGAITVNETKKIYAKASKDGYVDSDVASKKYVKQDAGTSGSVSSLVAVSTGYTFIAESIVPGAGKLYLDNKIYTTKTNTVKTDKGSSTIAGESYPNRMRLRDGEDVVFKPDGPCLLTLYCSTNNTNAVRAGSEAGGDQYGSYTTATTDGTREFIIPAAGIVYVTGSGDNADWCIAGFTLTELRTSSFNLNAKGFATYSSAYDFTFSGAKAYKMALDETAKTITGTEVTGKIAAGEGILLKGEAGATVTITETVSATALEGNSLKGSTKADGTTATKPTYCYVLSGDTFMNYSGESLTANKAYIQAGSNLANSLDIVFEGDPTAVEAIAETKANAEAPVKVIKNGKLYIGNYNVAGARIK